MSFEPVTPSQAEQHKAWKAARERLRAPEFKQSILKPRLVISKPLPIPTQTEDEVRQELMDFTIAAVANVAGLSVTDILSGVPTVEICNARNLAIALCAARHRLSERHIADYFGVHLKAVTNAAKSLSFILIDLTISSRTPLELILPSIWPRWIAVLQTTSVSDIQHAVCERWGILRNDLISSRRQMQVVVPRQAAMALAKHLTKNSYPEIGRKFGGKDHTTVMHSVRKYEDVISNVSKQLSPTSPVMQWVSAVFDQVQETPFYYKYAARKKDV